MGEGNQAQQEEEREVLRALESVPLRSADSPDDDSGVSQAHVQLAAALLRVVRTGSSEVVLTWPASPDGLVALHALAALGVCARSGSQPPTPLRIAYFPWTTRAGDSAKRALVDRDWVVRVHMRGLTRALKGRPSAAADRIVKLHSLMVRLQDLDGEVHYRGKRHMLPQYRHPALAEVVASGADATVQKLLLHRTRRYTSISKLHFDDVDGLKSCPFALVGIPDQAQYAIPLDQTGDVDAILVNGLLRRWEGFGDVWIHHVEQALVTSRAAWRRPLPVIAITDDPWFQWVFCRQILPKHLSEAPTRGVRVSTVLLEPSRIYDNRPPFEAQGAEELVFYAPSGAPAALERSYRVLLKDASSLAEWEVLELLQDSRRAFRNLVSLPTSLGNWKAYLREEMSAEDAAEALRRLDPTGPLNRIEAEYPEQLSVQANLEVLSELRVVLRDFVERHTATDTAVAAVFRKLIDAQTTREGSLAVVIADERVRDFVDHALSGRGTSNAAEADPQVRHKALVLSLAQFRAFSGGRPAPFTNAIILGASRRSLLQLLSGRWLPTSVAIIADVTTIGHIAASAERLEKRPELQPLSDRLSRVYVAADSCVKASTPELPGIELDAPGMPDFDGRPTGGVVDLSGIGPQDAGPRLRIHTENGAVILCRRKSTIVLFDADAPVEPFSAEPADEILPGDGVCVLSRIFFDSVRERLGSSPAVAEDVRAYHHFVAEKISHYPGAGFTDKASRIARAMLLKGCHVSESRVGDWIRAERWLTQGDTTVRPHAPWQYRDFSAFLDELGAPEPLIARFWQFGVLATRTLRLSAALQFYELCIAILTKHQEMVAQHPNKAQEFNDIRARAEETVATVTAVIGLGLTAEGDEPLVPPGDQRQLTVEGAESLRDTRGRGSQ
jgi:hypothetical protein